MLTDSISQVREQFEKTQIAGGILLLSGASVDGIIAAFMMKRRKM